MGSIIGFSLFDNLDKESVGRLLNSEKKALSNFDHLEQRSFACGETQLNVWGHKEVTERVHTMPDGSLLALIGSPHGNANWFQVQEDLMNINQPADFELPWDGRVILLRISADGKRWTKWNDWLGSIPVFHAQVGKGRIASTLEPVIVDTAGFTVDDIFTPGLVSMLINGHFLSDWTLYKDMKILPPDSVAEWNENGLRVEKVWSVQPSQSRWETNWDDLVDEMYDLSHRAIADTLKKKSTWILPLSSGLDSRLIAGVAADVGADVSAFAWGASDTTDAVYSRKIAKTLGFPWKRIDLHENFLVKYTQRWAGLFGSDMHFHGMYQMTFLDEIANESEAPIISGFLGDVLSGDAVKELEEVHSSPKTYQLEKDWYSNWQVDEVIAHVKIPVKDSLEANSLELKTQIEKLPGAFFQKLTYLELWNRQRRFTNFQSTLADYWRGVATPYLNKDYARFCLSLPRAAFDRRLLADVFRRYYGRLAIIPGTYANEPFILTGRYLLRKRLVNYLPKAFRRGPFAGFDNVQLRMDMDSIRAVGKDALWPLFAASEQLANWLDVDMLYQEYRNIHDDRENYLALKKLQSAQTLAYRLL
ncbi:MAG TPA: hypothetical protein DCX53_09565 [Anaerolineae bacterium]|nr:hypothetical protein [Anaerolineae bacterium]